MSNGKHHAGSPAPPPLDRYGSEAAYAAAHSDSEGDYLYKLWRATNLATVHGYMASGHLQGRLLKMLVMMQRPQYIIEVGTFSGYSAICMAEGLKELCEEEAFEISGEGMELSDKDAGGNTGVQTTAQSNHKSQTSSLNSQNRKLFTFEINDEMEDFTRPWIEGSGLADFIDFRIGDAITEAPRLGVGFDMAFIDGDKRTYVDTYDALFPLMRPGAIMLADNTLWDGHVVDPAYDHDAQTVGIRRFNDHVARDTRVEKVVVPIRDGITIIRKRPAGNLQRRVGSLPRSQP